MKLPWWVLGGLVAAAVVVVGLGSVALFTQGFSWTLIGSLLLPLVSIAVWIVILAGSLALITFVLGRVFGGLRRLGPPDTR